MTPFEKISKSVFERIKNTELSKFTLEDIKRILEARNFMLELFELDWVDFDSDDEEELEFKNNMYLSVKDDCKSTGLTVEDNELEQIFRIEMEIVGNKRINYYNSKYFSTEDGREIDFKDMVFKKEYVFDKWTEWEDCIDDAIEDFFDDFDLFPNVLTANKYTFSQINFLVNNIPGKKDGIYFIEQQSKMKIPVDEEMEIELGRYESEDYSIQFYFDQRIKDKIFILEYKEDLDDDEDDDDENGGDDNNNVDTPVPVNVGELVKA